MDQPKAGFMAKTASLLMVVQVLSRALGWVRETIMVNMFGRGYITDAYTAAFTVPDLIYTIVAGGAIAAAFIPVFSSYLVKGDKRETWRVSSIFTTWVMLLMLVLCVFAFFFTEQLLGAITSYSFDQMQLPVTLTRIMLAQAIFMALSAIATGILQSHQVFFSPAMGTLLYNVFIILGGVLLMRPIENLWPGYGVAGFSIGVVVGALVTILVQVPALKRVGFRYRPSLDTKNPGFRQLVKLIIPTLIGLSVEQINTIVTQKLATGLDEGILTALRAGYRLMQMPLGVFAFSIAIAIFPTMTSQFAQKDIRGMKETMSMGLRNIMFIIMPAMVGIIALREPIIRLLYEFSEKFTAADTAIAAQCLLFYSIGMIGYAAVAVLARGFYAMQNTRAAVAISATAIAVNIAFSYLLVGPLEHRGLALAFSISGLTQAVLMFLLLRRRIGNMGGKRIAASMLRTLFASILMGLAVWGVSAGCAAVLGVAGKIAQLVQVCLSVLVGVIVFFVLAKLMNMDEMKDVSRIFARRFKRNKS